MADAIAADYDGPRTDHETAGTPQRTPLGALLTHAGLITEEQLQDALAEGTATGMRIGEVVVARGWVSEDDVAKLLAEQWQLGYVDRASIWFDADALTRMSREEARRLEALPTRVQDGRVVVAVAEPTEARLAALREVIGHDTVVVVVPKSALDAGLRSDLLAARAPSESAVAEPREPPEPPERQAGQDEATNVAPPAAAEPAAEPPPIAFPIRAISVAEPDTPPPVSTRAVPADTGELLERVQEAVAEASTLQQQAASLGQRLGRLAREVSSVATERDADRRRIEQLEEQLGQRTELTEQLKSHLGDLTRTLEQLD